MLDIPPSLQSKLDQDVTTLCHCWRVRRKDGVILGFTDHDVDIVFNGVVFLAGAGRTSRYGRRQPVPSCQERR